MSTKLKRFLLSASGCSFVAVAALPATAHAQASGNATSSAPTDEESRYADDEIIVTARQQGETLVSVPVAATALTADDLTRNNATDFTKIAEMVPQVTIARTPSGNGGSVAIRGIGSSQQDAGVEQMVSLAFDGLQISRGRAVVANMFDLRQVEVLKGPQALFFGKNAPAGVVSIYSEGPTDELSGYISATYEFEAEEKRIEGAISGPITDTLGARLAFRYSDLEGWITNKVVGGPSNGTTPFPLLGSATKKFPAQEDIAGRLTLTWEPTSSFKATLKASYAHGEGTGEGGSRESWCALPGNNLVTVASGQTYVETQTDCKIDGVVAHADIDPRLTVGVPQFNNGRHYSEFDVYIGVLTAEYGDGPVSVASTTGYLQVDATGSYNNCMAHALGWCFAYNAESFKSFSQQVRAISDFDGPLNFTVGAYVDTVDRTQDSSSFTAFFGLDPNGLAPGGSYVDRTSFYDNSQSSYSVFGQLRWDILENLELAGGARYTKEKKTAQMVNAYVHPSATGLRPEGNILSSSFDDDNISPEVTLTYHPTPSTTLYGAYKTGYLSGGISNPGLIRSLFNSDNVLFKSAKAEGGEIGAKGEFLGRSLRADLVAYQYDFSNLQVTQVELATQPPSFITKNAAKARSRGVEASINWQASDAFNLHSAVGYNDSKYKSFTGANCYRGQTAALGCSGAPATQDLSGQRLYRAPKLTANFGAGYNIPLGGDMDLEFTGDATYTSKHFTDANNSPFSQQDGFWRFNASVTLSSESGWSLALIGRNLSNKRYILNSLDRTFGSVGEISSVIARPREINLQARFKF